MYFLNKKRFILLDGGALMFKSIFGWSMQKKMGLGFVPPSSYLYFQTILGVLKRIGVTEDDQVFMCVDGRNSWRKLFYPIYKGQRKEAREKSGIDWQYHFDLIGRCNQQLSESTDWQFLYLSNCLNPADLIHTPEGEKFVTNYDHVDFSKNYGFEADDLQAYFSGQFPDHEVVLVTLDKDLYQLCFHQNTKIFSLNVKYKGFKGLWAVVDDPIKVLNDKVRLGDASDNIIVDKKNDTEHEVRRFIIDLINLPEFVTKPITNLLQTLEPKEIKQDLMPCQNSLAKKFFDIYKTDHVITYETAVKYLEGKDKRKKKKEKENRLKKKLEKQEMEKSLR